MNAATRRKATRLQTQAAQMLGIDRVSLWRKLKRHEAKGGA